MVYSGGSWDFLEVTVPLKPKNKAPVMVWTGSRQEKNQSITLTNDNNYFSAKTTPFVASLAVYILSLNQMARHFDAEGNITEQENFVNAYYALSCWVFSGDNKCLSTEDVSVIGGFLD